MASGSIAIYMCTMLWQESTPLRGRRKFNALSRISWKWERRDGRARSFSLGDQFGGLRDNIRRGTTILAITDRGGSARHGAEGTQLKQCRDAEPKKGRGVKLFLSDKSPASQETWAFNSLSLPGRDPGRREPALFCGCDCDAVQVLHLRRMKTPTRLKWSR